MSSENAKPNQTGKFVSIGVGILLLGGMSFFAVKYFQEKSKSVETNLNIEQMTTEIEDLELNLDNYKDEMEDANLDIEDKERLLAEKETELQEKQQKIDRLLAENKITKSEAARYKAKIEQLEYYLTTYQKTIDEQKAEIAALKDDKGRLLNRVDTLKGRVNAVELERDAVKNKLTAASILVADGFRFFRLKSSGREVEDTEFRKGRIEVIRICFKVMENIAANAGQRDIYLQLKDPSGTVIKDAGVQSGVFTAKDGEKAFSVKKSINYERTTQEVCIEFNQPENYDYGKGTHRVVIYADGYDIGKSSFEVK